MGRGLILAIESSCDETAAAVVERGARTLSSVVASQIDLHARYGGVVPELASREHLRAIVPVVRAALAQAGVGLGDLDAIAVTAGPGLAGALLVGITYAKALAFATGLPLIAVNHLEGHIHAVLLHEREALSKAQDGDGGPGEVMGVPTYRDEAAMNGAQSGMLALDDARIGVSPGSPTHRDEAAMNGAQSGMSAFDEARPGAKAQGVSDRFSRGLKPSPPSGQSEVDDAGSGKSLALVVSGGHTHLYLAHEVGTSWRYKLVGRTVDDAAGEAYDKVAKLLGLGYPGGPWMDALARFGNAGAVPFAFSRIKTKLHLSGKAPRTKGAVSSPIADLDARFLFSFSGVKTAVLRYVELHGLRAEAETRRVALFAGSSAAVKPTVEQVAAACSKETLDLIASFQRAVVGDLMKKTFAAAEALGARRILITGGVAANRELRARFAEEAERRGVTISFPTLALSTDNAAMIGAAAWPRLLAGEFAGAELSAEPGLVLGR